jgi:UDP-N-acetylmuramyl tripeptide synthase
VRVLEIVSTIGPSRRSDATVVEMVLLAEGQEAGDFGAIVQQLSERLPARLASLGVMLDDRAWQSIAECDRTIGGLAVIVCNLALALQNTAGHDLHFHDFLQDGDPRSGEMRYRFIFEHDDIPTGEQAGDLAWRIIADLCPQLHWQALLHDVQQPLPVSIAEFIAAARPLVTPRDSLLLMAAARARGIPVLRLERAPYGELAASFRVAPNGMVMLGHSRHRVIMDGLFCISGPGLEPGPGFGIMKDRRSLWALLAQLGAPLPVQDFSLMHAGSPTRARRAARRLGFPLRVRPMQREPQFAEGWLVASDVELDRLLQNSYFNNIGVLLEPEMNGSVMDLLLVGGRLLGAWQEGRAASPDPALIALALRIDQALKTGFLRIRFQSSASMPGGTGDWVVRDVDPSPPVSELLADEPQLLESVWTRFLEWLYPPGRPFRIPIVSVTGTNGKTTTSTMISRMAQAQSMFVGMARTTGVYFDRELKEFGDRSGFLGHCMVFENDKVDLAVLETARGDVLRSGFAFDYSDVAVCTNVTADHLGEHGVETVEDMAVVKRSILERSAGTVVLNGDDTLCLGMLPWLRERRIFLSTLEADAGELRDRVSAEFGLAVNTIQLEQRNGEEWLVLQDAGNEIPIIAANAIPATFNGAARHNVSNAMHAAAAAYALGLKLESIRQALGEFEMGFDSLPGRLNVHYNGRFHIIMDYAHNADGLRQLVRFTDQFPCKGRKILRFGVSPNASREACRAAATTVAGHYDHYICSGKPGHVPTDGLDTPAELRQALLSQGTGESQVEIFIDPTRSVEYPVSLCSEGDLLVLVTANVGLTPTWEKILQT